MRSTAKSSTGRWSTLTDKELHEAHMDDRFWTCFCGVLQAKIILKLGAAGNDLIRDAEKKTVQYLKVER